MEQENQSQENQDQQVEESQDQSNSDTSISSLEDALKVIEKLRRENGSKRVKNKELEEKAAKYDEYIDSQKTELERLTERANAAEAKAEQIRVNAIKDKLIEKYKLSEVDHELVETFLVGTTEEELEAKAKKLAPLKGDEKDKKGKPDFYAGQRGTAIAVSEHDGLNGWFEKLWKESEEKSSKVTF